jgi:deoxyribonuclease-4
MKSLLFGTAGTPLSSMTRGSVGGIKRVRELGLDCMELEFVRGVRMGAVKAAEVRRAGERQGVHLSVHSPYYLNLNSREADKITATVERIYQSARIGSLAGAKDVVFHAAYYHKTPAVDVYRRVKKELELLLEKLALEGIKATLRPETTGRRSQFGTLEEVLRLSSELEGVKPCIDFAHLHARKGRDNTYEEFTAILGGVEEALGKEGLEDMHLHVSGIEYGRKGEIRHLVLAESDFNYQEMLSALRDYNVKGALICESPNLEIDAIKMRDHYQLGG